ncbi:cytotoxic and regulatory T-cell molecule [Xenopus tropicalis]|uniref:Cytotoxic and regulatory T-cell molecule n=1 Tax=Xenopus tropicalis TaxID=8364 RepID=A0A8J1JZD5_XENTR|nr:cytotoxic and regulatory T-cell molecule [Xenopus tropicalis]
MWLPPNSSMIYLWHCSREGYRNNAEFHTTHVYVEEGKAATLKCVFPGDDEYPLQWLTSRGFVAFFNDQKVLKDRRYELVSHSKDELIIRLSNITMQDEGIYTCLHYSSPVQNKTVSITVLAIPSKPVVDLYNIHGKSSENHIILNCSTSGSKPPPEMTWLIDDSMEVFGETKHRFEGNGKTCNTTSTLRIKAFKNSSTVKCILRHKALQDGNLTASFIFQNPPYTTEAEVPARNLITSQFPFHIRENESLSPFLNQNTSNASVETTSNFNETSHNTSITVATTTSLQFTDGNTAKHKKTGNYTTGDSASLSPFSEQNASNSYMETTISYNDATNQPFTSEFEVSARTSNIVLIWVAVTLMISFLMIIVHLFFLKLKKAHAEWKKENETSDQTLESTKSRSNNEDATNQQKNGHVGKQGSIIQYNKEPSV